MGLYEVIFQNNYECTGHNLESVLTVATHSMEAGGKALKKLVSERKHEEEEDYEIYSIEKIEEVDGYKITINL
jgi:hypothetical protein